MFKYLWSIFRHKWYVLLAGIALRVPLWRLIIHDLSKFTPSEVPVYRDRVLNGGEIGDRRAWGYAWHRHYMRNPHHWEYWRFDWQGDPAFYDGIIVDGCLEMPETYVREMVADWLGASRLYTGSWDMTDWLIESLPKMKMHPGTRVKVLQTLRMLGYNSVNLPLPCGWMSND